MEEWMIAAAASPVVYLAMYALATIDGFFPPLPSESIVITLATLAVAEGHPTLWLVVVAAALGAFTGDQIAFTIGRHADLPRLRVFRNRRGRQVLLWAQRALSTRGSSFILAARYVPIGRVAVNMSAGALGFPRRRFVGLTAIAAVTWALYGTAIGVGFGHVLSDHPVLAVVAGVITGILLGVVIDWVLRRLFRVQGVPMEPVHGLGPDDAKDDDVGDSGDDDPDGPRDAAERAPGPDAAPVTPRAEGA